MTLTCGNILLNRLTFPLYIPSDFNLSLDWYILSSGSEETKLTFLDGFFSYQFFLQIFLLVHNFCKKIVLFTSNSSLKIDYSWFFMGRKDLNKWWLVNKYLKLLASIIDSYRFLRKFFNFSKFHQKTSQSQSRANFMFHLFQLNLFNDWHICLDRWVYINFAMQLIR